MQDLKKHVMSFFPFAQKQLGFKRPPKLFFVNDKQNAGEILGKTAYYEPETETIKIYVTNRHPKDVLRSFSHELVHHAQNCRGDFDNDTVTEEGYAQNDPHLREMEREAYEKGNMIFRDYCDGLTNNGGLEQMSMTEDKLREAVRAAIQRLAEKGGAKPDFLDLDKDGDKEESMKDAAADADDKKKVDEASLADDPTAAEEAEAAERAAEGGESETKVNEEDELEESPSHPASDRSQGRDTGRRVKDVNSGERKEVAESVDELKEWYLGTLSESLIKKFTQK
tara:strand:+ start:356 stop:1201 length:846 start_codon:yes stop_codon:yes gene_type:complete